MTYLDIPNTVPSPTPASYNPPQGLLSQLIPDFFQGEQQANQAAVRNAFSGGLPTTNGDPNGPIDYAAASRTLLQLGDYSDASSLMQTGQHQNMLGYAARALSDPLVSGVQDGSGNAPPVGPNASGATPNGGHSSASSSSSSGQPYQNIYQGIFTKESNNDPTAGGYDQNGNGHYGYAQFSLPTWQAVRDHHPELNLPADPRQATDAQQVQATQALTGENAGYLAQNGLPVTDKTVYMAHFLGGSQAVNFLYAYKGNPNAPAAPLFPKEAADNPGAFYARDQNGNLQPLSLAQVYQTETGQFSAGNTTGFNPQVAQTGQPGAGAQSQPSQGATSPQGGVYVRTGQPAPVAAAGGATLTPPAVGNIGASGVPSALPTWPPFAPNGPVKAPATVDSALMTRGAPGQNSPGDGSGIPERASYAENMRRPPPSGVSGLGSPTAQADVASAPAPAQSGASTVDPTLGGRVPDQWAKKFLADGVAPTDVPAAYAKMLRQAASDPKASPDSAANYTRVADGIDQASQQGASTASPDSAANYTRVADGIDQASQQGASTQPASAPSMQRAPNVAPQTAGQRPYDPTLGGSIQQRYIDQYGSPGAVINQLWQKAAFLKLDPATAPAAEVLERRAQFLEQKLLQYGMPTEEQKNFAAFGQPGETDAQFQGRTQATIEASKLGAQNAGTLETVQPTPGGPKQFNTRANLIKAIQNGQAGPNATFGPGAGSPAGGGGIPNNLPVAEQPAFIAERQKKVGDDTAAMLPQYQARQLAKERLGELADLTEKFQTGNLAESKAEAQGLARALDIPFPNTATWNAAAYQVFTKNAIANVFNDVKSMGGRVLVSEIMGLTKANANAELQPEAAAKIIAQGSGILNYEDKHADDYFGWYQKHPGAYDTSTFEIPWLQSHSVRAFTDEASKQIAPLGQTVTPTSPKTVGQVYQTPKGVMRYTGIPGQEWTPETRRASARLFGPTVSTDNAISGAQ